MGVKKTKKDKQEYKFTFNGTTYTVAKGGIHSNEKGRRIVPAEDEILRDSDIGSQYPNAIVKRKLYPEHLGEEWLIGYKQILERRLEAKKARKGSLSDALKLALNGGGYGKTGEKKSWQYDPRVMYKCTVGNQIEILYLIEKLEINGIHVVSANTDGIVCLFPRSLDALHGELCKEWEEEVGNIELGKLEHTDYKALYQTSVNDYLAVKTNGELKSKGDFSWTGELHKNMSKRIVPIAIREYLVNQKDIEETIRNHKNIYDFCMLAKPSKEHGWKSKFVHLNKFTSEEIELQKTNRYYVSTDGYHLLKRLPPLAYSRVTRQLDIWGNVDKGTRESEVHVGRLTTIFNKYVEHSSMMDYHIDYDFYIQEANKIIKQVEKEL